MSYAAALDSLYTLAGELHAAPDTPPGTPRRKFDLAHMRVLTAALGHPERRFPSVLVAGTNGKGSTSATLAAILAAAGYRTGLYTSPHLTRVNERIRISRSPIADPALTAPAVAASEPAAPAVAATAPDLADISDDDFARLYFRVDDAARALVAAHQLPSAPSFFETVTAVAFLAFAEAAVDIAVLEVGMGGRLDATNIVDPLLSVITDISLDHTEWLGPTISAIAREKAGILRPGGVLVTLPQHPGANQAIGEAAVALGVRAVNAAEYMPARADAEEAAESYPLAVLGERIQVASPLHGAHQQRNLALAIAAAVELSNHHGDNIGEDGELRHHRSYKLTASHIEQGIRATRWPGRLESFTRPGEPASLLDVAHNPAGAWALRAALSRILAGRGTTGANRAAPAAVSAAACKSEVTSVFRPKPAPEPEPEITILFGCLRDKPIAEIAQILFPLAARVILTEVPSPRAASLAEMQLAATGANVVSAASPADALRIARELTPASGLIVVTGSVYLIGELRPRILAERASEDPGAATVEVPAAPGVARNFGAQAAGAAG